MKLFLVVISMAAFMIGCAGSPSQHAVKQIESMPPELYAQIADSVKQANNALAQGNTEQASIIYHDLLQNYESANGAFECAILTNLSWANINEGDLQRFRINADQAVSKCAGINHLSRETQIVLLLRDEISNIPMDRSDMRIDYSLGKGVRKLLQGGSQQ